MHRGVHTATPRGGWWRNPRGRRRSPGLGLRHWEQLGPRWARHVSVMHFRRSQIVLRDEYIGKYIHNLPPSKLHCKYRTPEAPSLCASVGANMLAVDSIAGCT